MMEYVLAFLMVVAAAASAAPSPVHRTPVTPEERETARLALQNPDMFEGDMAGYDPHDRNAIADERLRWPGAVVPYVIDDSLEEAKPIIYEGIQSYHKHTCVKFVARKDEKNYLKIYAGKGCWGNLGMQNDGQQYVSLGDGCLYVGTVIHELGHTLGFNHEQTRSDRDKYLTIYWENIETGQAHNFGRMSPDQEILYNTFDYDSIMIYGNYAFAKDNKSMTMEDINKKKKLIDPYDKNDMTESDILRVNKMYKCNKYL